MLKDLGNLSLYYFYLSLNNEYKLMINSEEATRYLTEYLKLDSPKTRKIIIFHLAVCLKSSMNNEDEKSKMPLSST